ncbi:MAG: carboxylating nicotinate-nucleotide diphosphorylase [Coriobacteriia bacterium]
MVALPEVDGIISLALAEDFGVQPARFLTDEDPSLLARDVTSWSVIQETQGFSGQIVARTGGVVCGLPIAVRVWETLARAVGRAGSVQCALLVEEGARVTSGDAVLRVTGPARIVLAGERTALDFVMVLSGIASEADRWQSEAGPGLRVHDTRKTVPGLRALSKYAVLVGGAHNHRMGLWDMALIKDNHLARAGGVTFAIEAARQANPSIAVEVEVETYGQAIEAAMAGADFIMLDNMDDTLVRRAVTGIRAESARSGRECTIEVSGTVTFDRLKALADTGADMVSSSAIALARPLDFGLDEG